AEVLVHPECDPEVQEVGDHVLSTGGMLKQVHGSSSENFIIGTEIDMSTRISRENPEKSIMPAFEEAICENMKLHTLEKVKNSLLSEEFIVKVPENIASRALKSVERMLEISS
ncbi:MAG TPA: quinolinate synthase NadA, partial [Methanobacteriaceae archaeon]|nr:quinolinate synthase NadA [Methanobacteriaceae archaeon]